MRLAIADPPYPPYADRSKRGNVTYQRSRATRWYGGGDSQSRHAYVADEHPDAADWDNPDTHQQLLADLISGYEGWAIATSADGADVYGSLPRGAHRMIWVKPRSMPGGNRIISMHEVVLLYVPETRRARTAGQMVPDVLVEPARAAGFTGSKPPRWTQWVLEALGYDPAIDVVHDLFPGSGAVTKATAGFQPGIFGALA